MILLTYGQRLKVTVSLVGSQFTHKNKFRDSDCNLIPCNSYIHLSLSTASWSFQANCEIGNWQLDKLESATDASFLQRQPPSHAMESEVNILHLLLYSNFRKFAHPSFLP